MTRFAENTTVSVERSQQELRDLLRRYKAGHLIVHEDIQHGGGTVQFEMRNRILRFVVDVPAVEAFRLSPTGSKRSPEQVTSAWEKEERRRWRVLLLSIKARLEEITDWPENFDRVFLGYIVLPNNETTAEALIPMIAEAYSSGTMPSFGEAFMRALPPPQEDE